MDAQAPNRLAPQPGYGAGPAHQHRSHPSEENNRPGTDQFALDKTHSLMNADMGGVLKRYDAYSTGTAADWERGDGLTGQLFWS